MSKEEKSNIDLCQCLDHELEYRTKAFSHQLRALFIALLHFFVMCTRDRTQFHLPSWLRLTVLAFPEVCYHTKSPTVPFH